MKIDILLSTYGDRILGINRLIQSIDFSNCNLIIAHQFKNKISSQAKTFIQKLLHENNNISYYQLNSFGVTKSRNFLINKAKSNYIAFCDDDIYYFPNAISTVLDKMEHENIDVATCMTITDDSKPLKNYASRDYHHNKRTILRVGTVEIICKRESILKTDLFPEDMGAGALFPLCDEPVFLNNCLKQSLKVQFLSIPLCYHPNISSGSNLNRCYTIARGVCFRRIYGMPALLLILIFSLKMKLKYRKLDLLTYTKSLYRGYNEGK
ncbi:glycosyltransferase family 2 protein [Escherichia coli]|nr:glycosyltransferase family 2 protein [Escherichia coli]HBD1672974.1 glycosyltransferase family 2 protein [Escherichia coli]